MRSGLFDALLDWLLHPGQCGAGSGARIHCTMQRLSLAHAAQEKLEGRAGKNSRSCLSSEIMAWQNQAAEKVQCFFLMALRSKPRSCAPAFGRVDVTFFEQAPSDKIAGLRSFGPPGQGASQA